MSHKSLIENLTILRGSHIEANENIRAFIINEAIQAITQLEQKLTESEARVKEVEESLSMLCYVRDDRAFKDAMKLLAQEGKDDE